jgi:hypothetical protein
MQRLDWNCRKRDRLCSGAFILLIALNNRNDCMLSLSYSYRKRVVPGISLKANEQRLNFDVTVFKLTTLMT